MHDHKVHATHLRKALYQILDEVEAGESILIERHGKVVAQITPVASRAERLASYWAKGERLITTVADDQLRGKATWQPDKFDDL